MKIKRAIKHVTLAAFYIMIGTLIVLPIQAHYKPSKDAHTLGRKHSSSYAPRSWVKKYWYTKRQSNSRYWTKGTIDSQFYRKGYINDLIANYLTSSAAASTYLTQSNAASTYLTQSNAASTYLTPATANNNYINASGDDTMNGTLTVTDINLSPVKTSYLTIPAAAFKPLKNDGSVDRTEPSGVYVWHGTPGASGNDDMVAPVYLPHGANVTQLSYSYRDQSSANTIVYLRREGAGSSVAMATITTSGSEASLRSDSTTNISYPTIDNEISSYSVIIDTTGPTSNLSANSVRITYTYNSL